MIPCTAPDGLCRLTVDQRSGYGTLEPVDLPDIAFRPDVERFYAVSHGKSGLTAKPVEPDVEMLVWFLVDRSKPNDERTARTVLARAFGDVEQSVRHDAAREYATQVGVSLIREDHEATKRLPKEAH